MTNDPEHDLGRSRISCGACSGPRSALGVVAGLVAGADPDARSCWRPCWAGWGIRWWTGWSAAGRSRNTAVILVFTVMSLILVLALVLLVPLLERQVLTLMASLPQLSRLVHRHGVAVAGATHGPGDPGLAGSRRAWSTWSANTGKQAGGIATTVLGYVSRSGFAVLGMVANIVLLPVLTFFFLRDWDLLVGRVACADPA